MAYLIIALPIIALPTLVLPPTYITFGGTESYTNWFTDFDTSQVPLLDLDHLTHRALSGCIRARGIIRVRVMVMDRVPTYRPPP